jgi:3D (Asp-Asp-Asp) domain-containing protein
MFTVTRFLVVVALAFGVVGTATAGKERSNNLKVTATAYNSIPAQTDSTPDIAAWGDRLRPGMKAIAVSRDLLNQYGLSRGDKVRIKGLEGEYVVLDKMNKRWRKKIDIYMGKDRRAAKQWGRRNVTIEW